MMETKSTGLTNPQDNRVVVEVYYNTSPFARIDGARSGDVFKIQDIHDFVLSGGLLSKVWRLYQFDERHPSWTTEDRSLMVGDLLIIQGLGLINYYEREQDGWKKFDLADECIFLGKSEDGMNS